MDATPEEIIYSPWPLEPLFAASGAGQSPNRLLNVFWFTLRFYKRRETVYNNGITVRGGRADLTTPGVNPSVGLPPPRENGYEQWCAQQLTYEVFTQCFSGWVIRVRVPHREGNSMGGPHRESNSMGGPLLFNVGIRDRQGGCEWQRFTKNWQSNQEPRVQGPVWYPPSYCFT